MISITSQLSTEGKLGRFVSHNELNCDNCVLPPDHLLAVEVCKGFGIGSHTEDIQPKNVVRSHNCHMLQASNCPDEVFFDRAKALSLICKIKKTDEKIEAEQLFDQLKQCSDSYALTFVGKKILGRKDIYNRVRTACDLFKTAALQGNVRAQYLLGVCLYDGVFETLEKEEAQMEGEALFRQASAQGYAKAMVRFSQCLRSRDSETAVELVRHAMDKGNANAILLMSMWCEKGDGVKQDEEKAKELITLIEKEANVNDYYKFAKFYEKGLGVATDEKKAFEYYEKASKDNVKAMVHLAKCYFLGKGVEKDENIAFNLWKKAWNDKQYYKAAFYLGYCYYKGEGVEENREEALLLWRAIRKSCKRAVLMLGVDAEEYLLDTNAAEKYFKEAGEMGSGEALFRLGFLKSKGAPGRKPFERDIRDAIPILEEGAKKDNEYARIMLAVFTGRGYAEKQAKESMIKQLTAIAKGGGANAAYILSVYYANGNGVQPSLEKSQELLAKAVEGHCELMRYTLRSKPSWAKPVFFFFQQQITRLMCIRVQPDSDCLSYSGESYALAAPSLDIQEKLFGIIDSFSSAYGFTPVVPIPGYPLVVRGNILRDETTGFEYMLQKLFVPLNARSMPDWTRTVSDFFKMTVDDPPSSFFVAIVKGKGNQNAYAAIKPQYQKELLSILEGRGLTKKKKEIVVIPGEKQEINENEGTEGEQKRRKKVFPLGWTQLSYPLQVDCVHSLIKDDKSRVYRLHHVISPMVLSNPYKNGFSLLSALEYSDDIVRFRFNEIVNVKKELILGRICHRYTLVLEDNREPPVRFVKKEGDKFFLKKDEEGKVDVFDCVEGFCNKINYKGGVRDVCEGEFVWLYEDKQIEDSNGKIVFSAEPFHPSVSELIEEAKLKGKETVEVLIGKKKEKFMIELCRSRMVLYSCTESFRPRRVWRFGTPFCDKVKAGLAISRRLCDNNSFVPPDWQSRDASSCGYVLIRPDCKEFDFVCDKIHDSIATRFLNHKDPALDGRLFHIAAAYRIEKPGQFLAYCDKKNEIRLSRGTGLKELPTSMYLRENPPSTGPIMDDSVNEVWAFSGVDCKQAAQYVEENIEMSSVCAGRFFSDDVIKAIGFSMCSACRKSFRNNIDLGRSCPCGCTCDQKSDHIKVFFLSRVALGNSLLVRDDSQYLLHGDRLYRQLPMLGFDRRRKIVVWFDSSVDKKEEAMKEVERLDQKNSSLLCRYDFVFKDLEEAMVAKVAPYDFSQFNIFFVKNAKSSSSGYDYLVRQCEQCATLKKLSFAMVVDSCASDDAVSLACRVQRLLNTKSAAKCFYFQKGVTLRKLLLMREKEEAQRREECVGSGFDSQIALTSQLSVEPGRDKKIELPNLAHAFASPRAKGKEIAPDPLTWNCFQTSDSVFVEDSNHKSLKMALKYPVSIPSTFDCREKSHRRFVVFDRNSVYHQYVVFVLQASSKEELESIIESDTMDPALRLASFVKDDHLNRDPAKGSFRFSDGSNPFLS